jgi:hypothetical protein
MQFKDSIPSEFAKERKDEWNVLEFCSIITLDGIEE